MRNLIKKSILAIIINLLLISCDKNTTDTGSQLGQLFVSITHPSPGDSLRFSYTPIEQTVLEPEVDIRIIVHNSSYSTRLALTDSLGVWGGTLKIPDTATAIALHFKTPYGYDTNNKKGYVLALFDANGKAIMGAKASIAQYYYRTGNRYGIAIDKDSIIRYISEDIKTNNFLKKRYDIIYTQILTKHQPIMATTYMEDRIRYYEKKNKLDAIEYHNLSFLYYMSKDRIKSDSVKTIGINKFPKGISNRLAISKKFHREKDLKNQVLIFKKYERIMGFENANGSSDEYYSAMVYKLSYQYGLQGNFKKMKQYGVKLSNNAKLVSLYNRVASTFSDQHGNLEKAEKLSSEALTILQDILKDREKLNQLSSFSYRDYIQKSLLSSVSETNASINYKLGNHKKALEVLEKGINEKSNSESIYTFINLLLINKKYIEAQKQAMNFIINNKATDSIKTLLKKAYTKNNNTTDNYDTFFKNLIIGAKETLKLKINEEVLHKTAPNFSLLDLSGNRVSLQSLLGKTVILDFWATWCGPCVASFPAMQEAVEAYKGDDSVIFLFINTWEQEETSKETIAKFIRSKGYSFRVLFDEPVSANIRAHKLTNAYKVEGIPTKIIIDPNGQICFKIKGNSGDDSKMLNKLDAMIAVAKERTISQ